MRMTRDETLTAEEVEGKNKLKQEAEDYARKWLFHVKDLELYRKEDDKPKYIRIKEAYLAGALPREKHIEIDAEQIRALQKQNGELTDKVRELEAQVEKMKCGQNCKFEYWKNTGGCYDQKCRFTGLDCTNCKDKWKGKWEND